MKTSGGSLVVERRNMARKIPRKLSWRSKKASHGGGASIGKRKGRIKRWLGRD
jgi:hypothetical protein